MPNEPYILPKGIASTDSKAVSASQVDVVTGGFNGNLDNSVTDAQLLAGAVDALSITPGTGTNPNRFGGPIVPFNGSVTVGADNYDTYVDAIALYVRSDNILATFNLPSTAVINGRYPVSISILHQGGTDRDAGTTINPLNRVRVPDPAGGSGDLLRRAPGNTRLQFQDVRQNDFVTFTRQTEADPWIAHISTLTTGSLLLPDGLFNLKPETVRFPTSLTFITGIPTGFVPQAGDAYRVGQEDPTFGGYGVQVDDVIVALVDNPSRARSSTNADWLVIRNATNNAITLQELRFLQQVTEVDTFSDSDLTGRSDVSAVRVWLSTGILDHAPFITPSTDPDNPQSDGTSYVGGNEKRGDGFQFRDTENHPSALVYLDIDGSFDVETNEADVFLVLKDRDGAQVNRYSLEDHFRPAVLPGSTDTYYILDHFPNLQDNFSSINYINGYTIEVVYQSVERQFNLGSRVNVITSIGDGEIPASKLEPNAQALLNADHSLSAAEQAKLDGLQTGGTPTPWTAGELLLKLNAADPSNDIASYHDVGQQNGILANFGHTSTVTFLVPNFVTVTQLQRADNTAIKNPVTPIGTILGRQAFTSVLPASSFDINNPVGDAWIVDGTAANLELTGADDSFKIGQSNLEQDLHDLVNRPQVLPSQLPAVLETLSHDVTITTTTATEWRELPRPNSNTPELTRQFAALWDENRRTFGTDNYFDDLTGIQTLGYGNNNVFFYTDPNDPNNRSFPGAQSYILNDNIRIRNQNLEDTISDSFRKIIAFDYALQRDLSDGADLSMLRIGPSGSTPLLGLHHEEGLYLNIGRGDGGQRSRTVTTHLEGVSGYTEYPFGSVGGLSTLGEAEFLAPNTNLEGTTYPVTIAVNIRLMDNGNDEGTFTYNYTITDADTDQAETQFTATHTVAGTPRTFTWAIRYEHNHNHATFGQQDIIFIRDVTAESNAALTDYVSMTYVRTITWNAPDTYAREPVNAGNGHDDFGLFDPSRYNTEHVRERNRVILAFRPYELTDTSSDPEMAVHIIVDGEKEGSSDNGYLIRLHRPMNDFTFDDMSFGNAECAVSHIQCYDYDGGHLFGEDTLLDYYNAADSWLGFFRHPTESTDTIGFNGAVEVLANSDGTARGLIMTDVTTGNRRLIEVDNGVLTNKDA